MSPSIHHAATRHRVPAIQALRNYRLLCPNALFLRNGKVCEDCSGRRFPWPGIRHACYRDSRLTTTAVACMIASHRLLGTWRRQVARFIALTEFSKRKFIAGGLPADRIVVRPNFLNDPGAPKESETRRGGVFVGMLHPWKGADVLLEAWRLCGADMPLVIVGDGPERLRLQNMAATTVRFVGMLNSGEIFDLLKRSQFLVFPSIWYETFGRTIIEAFACGTPVIASRIGAAADLVRDKETGLLFEPGNAKDLAHKIEWVFAHPDAMRKMGQQVRKQYEEMYTPETACQSLVAIYNSVIARHNGQETE